MRRASAQDYSFQLRALLPSGVAWPSVEDPAATVLGRLLHGIGEELARVDGRAADLVDREADPRLAVELFEEWERMVGLPDPCVGELPTIQERRAELLARLTGAATLFGSGDALFRTGQSVQAIIRAAAAAGFEITIEENDPETFRAGVSVAGDPVTGSIWRYLFYVDAPETSIRSHFRAKSRAGEPLRTWGNEPLECLVNRIKPAHAIAVFRYGEP